MKKAMGIISSKMQWTILNPEYEMTNPRQIQNPKFTKLKMLLVFEPCDLILYRIPKLEYSNLPNEVR